LLKPKTPFSKPYLLLVIKLQLKLKCGLNKGNYCVCMRLTITVGDYSVCIFMYYEYLKDWA